MGGFFGVVSKKDCVLDLFFGTDYHSHLGTKRGGLAVYGKNGFERSIHNIENSPFRTKFEKDVDRMQGNLGIGCISDNESQPLLVNSHLGNFAITTVGFISNMEELIKIAFQEKSSYFLEMSGGNINPTELVVSIINQKDDLIDGIKYAQNLIIGSMSMLIMTRDGLYAIRDRLGRTPISIGRKDGAYCASFECFSYLNLDYSNYKELGAAEIVYLTPESCETVSLPQKEMKICSFLWVYYGYPPSSYEGVNVENMRYRCGGLLASQDNVKVDTVAAVPDSATAHAIGYSTVSNIPFSRPFIKYTPTWPRSFMPQKQSKREMIAKMKLIPIDNLIRDKKILLVEDSIVRGTQIKETTDFLYQSGANELHIRIACPPVMFKCKYLNFSRSTSNMDMITRRVIAKREKNLNQEIINNYLNPNSKNYQEMIENICKDFKFSSLKYNRLEDMISSIQVDPCKLCTYCWDGKE